MKSLSALAVLALVVTGACAKKPPAPPPTPIAPPSAGGGTTSTPTSNPTPTTAPAPTNSGITAERINELKNTIAEPIYFVYDSERLGTEALEGLERKAAVLAANSTVRIRIEGHADDRGSDEYNVSLGQRRAEAAKSWLVNRGIAAARIATVSYGEERPAVSGSTETSFAKNRRDNFLVVSGNFTVGQQQ